MDESKFELKGHTILIVDDIPDNLETLGSMLANEGLEISFATNGKQAIMNALSAAPDLILLDIAMPEMDGFEVCTKLKSLSATKSIPVIFITGHGNSDNIVKGFELGAVDYVLKPFNPKELTARIRNHLKLEDYAKKLKSSNEELRLIKQLLEDKEKHLLTIVENKTRKLSEMTFAMVSSLEDANAYNDSDTGNHVKRVSEYSARLAILYKQSAKFVRDIRMYASLHDVGKVAVPDHILKKQGPLTKEEFEIMKKHVYVGYKMLKSDALDDMARNITLYHHEKWNGMGYINGLKGKEIPLEARIVSIVDVFDALITERPYKKAWSYEAAYKEIEKMKGQHFQPELTELFLENFSDFVKISENLKDRPSNES